MATLTLSSERLRCFLDESHTLGNVGHQCIRVVLILDDGDAAEALPLQLAQNCGAVGYAFPQGHVSRFRLALIGYVLQM